MNNSIARDFFQKNSLINPEKYVENYLKEYSSPASEGILGFNIIKYSGFGNNIIQLAHAIYIARCAGLKILKINWLQPWLEKGIHKLNDGMKIIVDTTTAFDQHLIRGQFFYGFDESGPFGAIPEKIFAKIIHEDISRLLTFDFEKKNQQDTICIHIRGGDLFSTTTPVHPQYVQPPLQYYISALISEISSDSIVNIVAEDHLNPNVLTLKTWLDTQNIKHELQTNELMTDIQQILHANTIIAGYGTFIPMIALLSNNINRIYYFRRPHREAAMIHQGIDVRVLRDKCNNYIKFGDWINSKKQRETMINYPYECIENKYIEINNGRRSIEDIVLNRKPLNIRKRVSIILSCWAADDLVKDYVDVLISSGINDCPTLIAVDFPNSHKNAANVYGELSRYPNLIYIEELDALSLYEAWNIGIQAATTEFIAILNLDDRVRDDYYTNGVTELDAAEADVFSSASLMTDQIGQWGGATRKQGHLPDEYLAGRRVVSYGLESFVYGAPGLPRKRNPPHCAPIWRKRLHDVYGYFDCHRFDFCADFEFWLKVAVGGGKFIFLNEPKTLFFSAPGTASDRILHKKNESIIKQWEHTFPPLGYRETHLGRYHDLLHHCMNMNVMLSNRAFFWHLEKLVSVVIIGHAGGELFRECLASVTSQDYTLLDCVIVLDKPDSEVEFIANEFAANDARFRVVILRERTERNYARNVGIELSIGNWVCLVDGDDLLPKSSISTRVTAAEKNPECIIFGGLEIFNAKGSVQVNSGRDTFDLRQLRLGWPHHCTLLIPKSNNLVKNLRYPANPSDPLLSVAHIAGEDVQFMIELLRLNPKIILKNSGAPAYRYRRHESSSYDQRHISTSRVLMLLLKEFGIPNESDPPYSRNLAMRLVNFLCWCHVNKTSPDKYFSEVRLIAESISSTFTSKLIEEALEAFQVEFSSVTGSQASEFTTCSADLMETISNAGLGPHTLDRPIVLAAPLVKTHQVALASKITSPTEEFGRLLRFKNRHREKECLIICNGPSLKKIEFEKIDLNRFKIIGLNKIHLGFDMLGVRPDYIVAVNKKVIEQSSDEFNSLPIVKFISNRVDLSSFPSNPTLYHLNTVNLPRPNKRFSVDIVDYVNEGWTVTHAALQIAYYMGFKKVYIVGMDHRFTQHIPGQENKESTIKGDDVDHFHPGYFGHGQTWDLPDLKNSEISYQSARKVYEESGREIFDCTVGGACEIFKKLDVSSIYRNTRS